MVGWALKINYLSIYHLTKAQQSIHMNMKLAAEMGDREAFLRVDTCSVRKRQNIHILNQADKIKSKPTYINICFCLDLLPNAKTKQALHRGFGLMQKKH